MPTTRVPAFRCGTYFSGWLNGAHPSVEDGEVSKMICFSDRVHGCEDTIQIYVKTVDLTSSTNFLPHINVTHATVVQTDFEANALHVIGGFINK